MKINKFHKTRWFYAHGPGGEMVIENNQCRVVRTYNLKQAGISGCLLERYSQHRGWKFILIENPHSHKLSAVINKEKAGRITSMEFRSLQAKTGLSTAGMSDALNRAESTILQYRSGFLPCPGKIADKLRILVAKGKQVDPETNRLHMEAATTARIRNLMYSLYPQWCGVETDGHIFTEY